MMESNLYQQSTALMNKNNNVLKLKLSWNMIGKEGAKSLSTALMNENNKVTDLNLSYNNIGDDGVTSFINCIDE